LHVFFSFFEKEHALSVGRVGGTLGEAWYYMQVYVWAAFLHEKGKK
jgi:hypothetical protein